MPSHEKSVSLLTASDTSDVKVLEVLRISTSPLSSIQKFGSVGIATLCSPLFEGVFDATTVDFLTMLYNQLYPSEVVCRVSPFYEHSGRATLCGQVMGSVFNASSCTSSSVVMAFWPGNSNDLSNIDYSCKRIGVVQYYFRHYVTFQRADGTNERVEHVFAYVTWKK